MIRSIADFARACEEGRYHCQRFIKTGAGQAGDNRWQDWAFQAGQPAYDARIGQALAFTPSVAQGNDAIYFPPMADGMQRKLFKITMCPRASNSLQASIDFVLYDLVGYYPLIDGDSTDPQEFDNTLTLPRYTDGNGLRLVLVNHVAPAVQGGVMNLEYVDQTGATRTITLGVPNNGINGPCCAANSSTVNNSSPLVLPLHEGVTGVRQVNRITYTNGAGCRLLLAARATTGATAHNLSMSYTNQGGTSNRALPVTVACTASAIVSHIVHSGTAANNYGPYLPLASGDTGVQNVASVTLSAASGAGTAALLLVRPLAQIPLSIASLMTEKEFWNQLPSAPQIRDDACLGFILGTGAAVAAATTFAGANEVVWG